MSDELSTVQSDLKLKRAKLRLARTEAELRAYESLSVPGAWGSLVDMSDHLPYRSEPYRPSLYPQDRNESRKPSPLIRTENDLFQLQEAVEFLVKYNPYAGGLVETAIDFVCGEGMTFRADSREGAPKELIRQVQDVIDEFDDANAFHELQQELVWRGFTHGEFFERGHEDDAILVLREIEPSQVCQPIGSPDRWSWGVVNAERDGKPDVASTEAFAVHYGDPDDYEVVPREEILHAKRNVTRNTKRGLSDFCSTRESLEGCVKLARSMQVGDRVRAAIVGFWQYEKANAATVESHVGDKRDKNVPRMQNPVSGHYADTQYVEDGTIKHVPKGKTFLPPPASTATPGQVQSLQAALRMVAVRYGMPEYMVSADSSNSNYASTLVSGAPFVRRDKRWQRFFRQRFLDLVWWAIKVGYRHRKIRAESWEALQYLIDVQCEAPPPELANELEQAQVDDIDMQNGVMSKQTRRQRRGLDDEQETTNIKRDPVNPPQPPEVAAGLFPRPGLNGRTRA